MAKNAPSRLYSAAHHHNHGLAESIRLKLDFVKAPLTKNTRPAIALAKMEKVTQQRRKHQKSPAAKAKRAETRRANFKMHTVKRHRVTYEKDVVLRQSKQNVKNVAKDHNYGTRKAMHIEHPYNKHNLRGGSGKLT